MLNPEKISIADFKILKGQIDSPLDFDVSQIEDHHFEVAFHLSFDLENKLAKADFSVDISTKGEGSITASGFFHVVFFFQIDNLEELVEIQEDHSMKVQASLGNALASITYSTTRGILMTRFQGTGLQLFILPVIDPNKLLEPLTAHKTISK